MWDISLDGQWLWLGGDNLADGASSGSCEVGWVKLPGTTSKSPTWPRPNPETAPKTPLEIGGEVVGFWAPFDRRSEFEKKYRFFNDPDNYIIDGQYLVAKGQPSTVYRRSDGTVCWLIPGFATTVDAGRINFLRYGKYKADPREGSFDLLTGVAQIAPERTIKAPLLGEVDLRQAQFVESSGQDPCKVADGDSKSSWVIGQGSKRSESLIVSFPKPVYVRQVRLQYRCMYGTTLEVFAKAKDGLHRCAGQSIGNFLVDRRVSSITLTMRQKVRQPVTGAVFEQTLLK